MIVLITGATGRIGQDVTRHLLAAGARVRVLTRRPHRARELFADHTEIFEWHSKSEPVPAPASTGIDMLVHLMGEPLVTPPAGPDHAKRIRDSRVAPTRALAEALADRPVRWIVASCAGIYPDAEGGETSELIPLAPPKSDLQALFHDVELAAAEARHAGSTVATLRLGLMLAPNGFPDMLLQTCKRGMGLRIGSGAEWVPTITPADAARMVLWLIADPKIDGPINAVAPTLFTTADLRRTMSAATGKSHRLKAPNWLLRRALGLGAEMLRRRDCLVPVRAQAAGFVFSQPDANATLSTLLPARVEATSSQRMNLRAPAKV